NVTPTDLSIVNVSLYIDGNLTDTNSTGGAGDIYTFNKTLPDGDYNYTFKAYGNDGIEYPASNGTLFFTIDLVEPTITLNSPLNDSLTATENVTFNTTATAGNYILTNATVNLWFSNGTLFDTSTNASISEGEILIDMSLDGFSDYFCNVELCGDSLVTYCTFGDNNFSLEYSPFSENSVNFTPSVLETTNQNFTLN